MQYRFTVDTFGPYAQLWKEKLGGFAGMPGMRALEVGSFEGAASVWMLGNLLTGNGSGLTCVDSFELDEKRAEALAKMNVTVPPGLDIEAAFDRNIAASGEGARVTKLKGNPAAVLRSLPLDSFDLVYIDGPNATREVLADAVLCWDLLKLNGVMVLGGYRRNLFPDDWLKNPGKAIDSFMQCFDGEHVPMLTDDQVMLRKTRSIRSVIRSLSGRDT